MAIEMYIFNSRRSCAPAASIRKNGELGFNQAATRKFNLTTIEYVQIGYDKEKSLLVLKVMKDKSIYGVRKLCKHKGRKGALSCAIHIQGALEYFEIEYKQSLHRYKLEREGDMILLYLDKPYSTAPPTQSKH